MRKFGTGPARGQPRKTAHFRRLRAGPPFALLATVRNGRNITATPSATRPRASRREPEDGDLDRTGVFTTSGSREFSSVTIEDPRGYTDWRDTPLAHPRLVPRQLISPRAPQPTPTTALRPRRARPEPPPLTLPPSLPVEVPIGSEQWSEPGIAITPTIPQLRGSEPEIVSQWSEPGIAITPTTPQLHGSEPEIMWPDPPPRRDPPVCGLDAPGYAEPGPLVAPSHRRRSTERPTLPPPFPRARPLARGTAPILPTADFFEEASTGFR